MFKIRAAVTDSWYTWCFQCFVLVERYEEVIEDWYYHYQDQDLMDYLCRKHALKKEEQGKCLSDWPTICQITIFATS